MAEDRKMPSVRPDGTVRKEVKVRPGYMPAEMVKKYVIPARRDKAEVNNEREKPKEPMLATKETTNNLKPSPPKVNLNFDD
jgi:hypothetical protein